MSFPWLNTPTFIPADEEPRLAMIRSEIELRAAMLYRLGYPAPAAADRIRANLKWDFELTPKRRPKGLTDAVVDKLVLETYARRPSR